MNNKNLFWYGFRARLLKVFGVMLILSSFIIWIFSLWVALIILILGVVLGFWGLQNEYDYKRKGGYIVYND